MKKEKESARGLRIASDTGEEIRANVSDNTLKAYEHATRKLEDWLDGRTLNDAVLAEYIRFLHTNGKSPATINLLLSAVKWMVEYHAIDNVAGAITKRIWSDIRGEGRPRERRRTDGLTWGEVERVCTVAESSETVAGLRDAAMISLMSDCLLRISEAVAVDVEDIGKEGLQIRRGDRSDVLYICEWTRQLIKRYRWKSGIASGALFRRIRFQNHVTEDRLGVKGAREAIRRRATEAGVTSSISGHSLRVGAAVSLAEAGATVKEVQQAGRWQGPTMPARYVREMPAEQSPVERYKDKNRTDTD